MEVSFIKILLVLTIIYNVCNGHAQSKDRNPNVLRINKCCETFELLVDLHCTSAKKVNESTWAPIFTGYNGEQNVQVGEHKFAVGLPDCGPMQMWSIHHYPQSADKLILLPDGKLRHYVRNPDDEDDDNPHQAEHQKNFKPLYYDYMPGQYCMEKSIKTSGIDNNQAEYAKVCSPERVIHWTDTDYLLRKIINPICHGISMSIFMVIAIIYFVLPTLRDLVGNIITTITLCLIVSQAANLVRIFTEFSSHVSFFIADSVLYISLLGAFFWLNSLGYYIWKTFRSRNVFLRVTDGRKYCWYSIYAWGSTAVMSTLGIFAHYFLDSASSKKHSIVEDQETIGWLGISVIFTPIAFIVMVNTFFYASTLKILSRMNTYGRIHHKLKSNFAMFTFIFLVMTISWLFLILSWIHVDSLLYAHIVVNALQAPLMLYICVLRQKHVTFLLKKSCCYNEPPAAADWGDELTYMNTADF